MLYLKKKDAKIMSGVRELLNSLTPENEEVATLIAEYNKLCEVSEAYTKDCRDKAKASVQAMRKIDKKYAHKLKR